MLAGDFEGDGYFVTAAAGAWVQENIYFNFSKSSNKMVNYDEASYFSGNRNLNALLNFFPTSRLQKTFFNDSTFPRI